MKYITIEHWERHQHYKDRRPPWIKLEIEIIEEFDADGNFKKFHPMPDDAKLTFICLLCFRANFNEKIPFKDEEWLAKQLGIKTINLQPLVNAGYISIDSNSVAKPEQKCSTSAKSDTPEREREGETEGERETEICASSRSDSNGYSKPFLIFFENYPVKKSKRQAFKAWQKLKPKLEVCLKAIDSQKAEKQNLKKANQFCPEWKHPSTWLNQECWEDEPIKTETENERNEFLRRHGAVE